MAYKYQNEIEDAVDVMVKVMGEEKHGKAQQELAEVYRKAEAYDRVTEKLYARINHIIMTSHPTQRKPGYVDGLYNALDIISEDLESGERNAKK